MSLQQLIKVLVRQRIRNFIRNVSGQANLLKVELNFTVTGIWSFANSALTQRCYIKKFSMIILFYINFNIDS